MISDKIIRGVMSTKESIKELLSSADPTDRRIGCGEVEEAGMIEFVSDLVSMLADENIGVREAAVNALISIGSSSNCGGGADDASPCEEARSSQVAELVAPLLDSDDPAIRNMVVEILTQLNENALDTVIALTESRDDDISKFAVDILAIWGNPESLATLAKLTSHPNSNVRSGLADALGAVRGKRSFDILLLLLNDDEEWVRFSAVEALGRFDSADIPVDSLLEVLDNDSMLVKTGTIEVISKVATSEHCTAILTRFRDLLKEGHCLPVSAVVDMLEKAASKEWGEGCRRLLWSFKDVFFDFFIVSLKEEEDCDIRKQALQGLAYLGDERGIAGAIEYLEGQDIIDEDDEARFVDAIVMMSGKGVMPEAVLQKINEKTKYLKLYIRVAGELKVKDMVPVLAGLIGNVGKEELRAIVEVLEQIQTSDSVELLKSLLKSDESHVRRIAARSIGRLIGTEAVPQLFDALKGEKYKDVMEEITLALAAIPSPDVFAGFVVLLDDEKNLIRSMAARGLGIIGKDEAFEHLKAGVTDADLDVRKSVYEALARLNVDGASEVLVEGLKDSDKEVRLTVLKALDVGSKSYGEGLGEILLGLLKDKNVWVRYMAVQLIGELGYDKAEDGLLELASSDEPPVKAAVAKTLERVGTMKSIPVLQELLEYPDESVNEAVREAIDSIKWMHSN
jgi:HEAT repeat protein